MKDSRASERPTLPPPGGAPAVWAEWIGRRYGLFRALAATPSEGAWAADLARINGYDVASVELWLRIAYAHGLLAGDPHRGYRPAPDLADALGPSPRGGDPAGWGVYPPPYRLCCTLACFLRMVPAEAAARWAGAPVRASLGRVPLLVLVARYTWAAVGPEQRLLLPAPGTAALYREVAGAVLLEGLGGSTVTFPALWVDSPDRLPLDLGWRYGFPKYPAAVELIAEGRRVLARAADAQGELLRAEGWRTVPLPGRAVAAVAALRAVFPVSGLEAALRLGRVERAALLVVRRLWLPRLDALGLTGPTLGGLWLEGVRLDLSEPAAAP
ncbi:MAG: hypothetical protein HY689_11435 [Chloroflexi bacterium]|nr:hypothetical protein [Chloroflexota bacterium]